MDILIQNCLMKVSVNLKFSFTYLLAFLLKADDMIWTGFYGWNTNLMAIRISILSMRLFLRIIKLK